MKVETVGEQILFSTLKIDAPPYVGTGFIVDHQWGELVGEFLVTNKHVVEGTSQGKLTFTKSDGSSPQLGQTSSVTFEGKHWNWIGHPSDEVDVAVLPLHTALQLLNERNMPAFIRSIPTDLFLDSATLERIDAVEDVLFVGYPSGLYDEVNNLPITRRGITATPIYIDHKNQPMFLIDASVFQGSSGSPVFLYNTGSWSERGNAVMGGTRCHFLGVLAQAYYRKNDGTLHFEQTPAAVKPVFQTNEMIDIGVVYKAECVVQTIEHLLELHGEIPLPQT